MEYHHQPVMLSEVLEVLDPQPGEYFLDGTLGGGGYALALSQRVGEKGRILGLDLDPLALQNIEETIQKKEIANILVVQANFKDLKSVAEEKFGPEVKFNGVVLDLGLSSAQLEDRNRGFSFKGDTPLDMSFAGEEDKGEHSRVGEIVNTFDPSEMTRIFRELGEEKLASPIAKNIAKHRQKSPIRTSGQLEKMIEEVIPGKMAVYKNNIKARIFQALRMATNQELENLQEALPAATDVLKKGGKLVVISYHSLEDRLIKNFFHQESRDCICPPELPECRCGHQAGLEIIKHKKERGKTKKFLTPERREIQENPRARSAKLRAAQKIIT